MTDVDRLRQSICAKPRRSLLCWLGFHPWFYYEMTFINFKDEPAKVEYRRVCPRCLKAVG
jgi:hypothetical protein